MNNITMYPQSKWGYPLSETIDDNEVTLGHRFSAFFGETITNSAGTSIIAITTNDAKDCYLWAAIESDKAGLYEMYEKVICSGGSVLTAINNNRQVELTEISDAIITGNPTIATVGTFIGSHVIGSMTGGASKSGGSSSVNKYLANKNTTYMFRFTADAASTRVTHSLFWRECDTTPEV